MALKLVSDALERVNQQRAFLKLGEEGIKLIDSNYGVFLKGLAQELPMETPWELRKRKVYI